MTENVNDNIHYILFSFTFSANDFTTVKKEMVEMVRRKKNSV